MKRIPKGAREQSCLKLGAILADIVQQNSLHAWERLFRFPTRCLRVPKKGFQGKSLSKAVKQQLAEEQDPVIEWRQSSRKTNQPAISEEKKLETLSKRVSEKLEEGDFKGAVRIASSEDRLAAYSKETLDALLSKHPAPPPDSIIPPPPSPETMVVYEADVIRAVKSFPNGSAGGPDRLRPQHLKDMLQCSRGEGSPFVSTLAAFCSLVLGGGVPEAVRPFFFGASLVALEKKSGGVRPIAVGCTLRRLVGKLAGNMVMEDMARLLSPRQLGYGIRGGAEAAVHAARKFLQDLPADHALVKLDFCNAFNSVRRDRMLEAVRDLAPAIYPLVYSAYSSPSNLHWGETTIKSASGVQQGDPLGPLLFCLSIHHLCAGLKSAFSVMYLDDVTIGGAMDDILHDLAVIKEAEQIGLTLNNAKSEIICDDATIRGILICSLPGAQVVQPQKATLLGSPLGDVGSIDFSLAEKTKALRLMSTRFTYMSAHDSLTLLRHSFAIPRLQYLLRTAPCFLSNGLAEYDHILRETLGSVTNTLLTENDPAWMQASLPVKLGGLGVRSAAQVAPSAYLASVAATEELVSLISPINHRALPAPSVDVAMAKWSQEDTLTPPQGLAAFRQKNWDEISASASASALLESAESEVCRARLLATMTKESGAWLHALPITSLGLRMDDTTLRIAVGLRLGTAICAAHLCHHCGAEVDCLGIHGLSCRHSEGRLHRHAYINDIIHRALTSAKIPSRLEPTGLLRSDGKRPDGMTLVPWKCGQLLVWDATCPDTFAPSYRRQATSAAGKIAAAAEELKAGKYAHLDQVYLFNPVAIETSGALGPHTAAFLKDLGRRIHQETGEARSSSYLLQRLSVAVQRGNAAAVMGTCSPH